MRLSRASRPCRRTVPEPWAAKSSYELQRPIFFRPFCKCFIRYGTIPSGLRSLSLGPRRTRHKKQVPAVRFSHRRFFPHAAWAAAAIRSLSLGPRKALRSFSGSFFPEPSRILGSGRKAARATSLSLGPRRTQVPAAHFFGRESGLGIRESQRPKHDTRPVFYNSRIPTPQSRLSCRSLPAPGRTRTAAPAPSPLPWRSGSAAARRGGSPAA